LLTAPEHNNKKGIEAMKTILGATLLALSFAAHAEFINVDPDAFAAGTDISELFEGSTLTTLTVGPKPDDWSPDDPYRVINLVESAVYTSLCPECAGAYNGTNVLGASATTYDDFFYANWIADIINKEPRFYYPGGVDALKVSFDGGSNYVKVNGGGKGYGNFFVVDFWDTEGDYIGRCSVGGPSYDPLSFGCSGELVDRVTFEQALNAKHDPSSIIFKDDFLKVGYITTGGWQGGQHVKSITYAAPEPTPIVLLGVTLAGLVAMRMRRRRIAIL
jgi:hypothetical protein